MSTSRTHHAGDDAARLAKLGAESSRAMGVDFVPLARSASPGRRPAQEIEAKPAPTPPPAEQPRTAEGLAPVGSARLFSPANVAGPDDPWRAPTEAEIAAARAELDEIRARYEHDEPHKAFVTAHTRIVFGEGHPRAEVMFIGEAPGADEDRLGRPFVGRAGQLLDKMIVAMGLARADVYIANVLKTRPPNNATPTLDEARVCSPYLFDQVAAVRPRVIVTLGLPASRTLLDSTDTMTNLRGRWASFTDPRGRVVPVLPTYHPAFLLRSYTDENRRKVWSDLRAVLTRLGRTAPGPAPGSSGA